MLHAKRLRKRLKRKSGYLFSLVFLVSIGLEKNTQAFRSAVFPPELDKKATLFHKATDFFEKEKIAAATNPKLLERPLWIHGGDSLSTAWANRSSLAERIEFAETNEVPAPLSPSDLRFHTPRYEYTWYAGSKFGGGLFKKLEEFFKTEWVIYSTALTGAFLNDLRLNSIELMTRLPDEVRNRAQFISFSLGGNDLCEGKDPTLVQKDFDLEQSLHALKAAFPVKAKYAVWTPPPVVALYKAIIERLESLPDGLAKTRIKEYCQITWNQKFCPITSSAKRMQDAELFEERLRSIYQNHFGDLYDPFERVINYKQASSDLDILNLVGADCFHPSKYMQEMIRDEIFEFAN